MPFAPESVGACIPSISSQPSYKVRAFNRFDVPASTGGNIWIFPVPTICNDTAACVYGLSGTARPTQATVLNLLSAPSNSAADGFFSVAGLINLPFSTTQINQNNAAGLPVVSGRVVSYGIRICYTGTTLAQSGLVYCYSNPRHENCAIAPGFARPVSAAEVGIYADTSIEAVSRDFCEISLYPVLPSESNYTSTDLGESTSLYFPFSADNEWGNVSNGTSQLTVGGVSTGCPPAVICITGLSSGQTIHVEIIQHTEYSGTLAEAFATPNSTHLDDMGNATTIVENIPRMRTAHPKASLWDLVKMATAFAGKTAVKYAIPAAETALLSLLA